MRHIRSWLTPVVLVAGLLSALSGCVVYGGVGEGPHSYGHEHHYWR